MDSFDECKEIFEVMFNVCGFIVNGWYEMDVEWTMQ